MTSAMSECILSVLLLMLTSVPATTASSSSCTEVLQQFLTQIETVFNQSDHRLYVKLPSGGPSQTVCNTNTFQIELWKAIQDPKTPRPPDFGTREYFSKYQNCESPNPDLLWKHGESQLVSERGLVFNHIQGQEYLYRVCPCVTTSCSCGRLSVCSTPFPVGEVMSDQGEVFPWCVEDSQETAPPTQLTAPVIQHCPPSVRMSGTLPSCTPVRQYDQVEVILEPVTGEEGGPPDCSDIPQGGAHKLASVVPLHRVNVTHGTFNAEIVNITYDTYYCLRVALVNHPYCTLPISLSPISSAVPHVCRPVKVNKPILIETHVCGSSCPPATNLPLIAGVSVTCAVVISVCLILVHRLWCRATVSGETPACHQQLLPTTTPRQADVFFLYFTDCEELVTVSRLVGQWMSGLGHRVLDLADPLVQEEMAGCPETWLSDRLEEPGVKVVVVSSLAADNCLTQDSVSVSARDGMDQLRVFSLRHIQARLSGNYRRLAVLQCWEGGAGPVLQLVPHTRHLLPDHLPELQAWLADTHSWDDNDNMEQTLTDLKAAVEKYATSYSDQKL